MDPQRSSHDSKSTACEALLSSCKELEVLIPKVSSTEAIKHANRSLRSVISLLKDSVMPLTPTSSYAASSNHQKQLRFYSTKENVQIGGVNRLFKKSHRSVINFLLFQLNLVVFVLKKMMVVVRLHVLTG